MQEQLTQCKRLSVKMQCKYLNKNVALFSWLIICIDANIEMLSNATIKSSWFSLYC